ncbi:hypothetical protein D9M73_121190 [compost metagenome]
MLVWLVCDFLTTVGSVVTASTTGREAATIFSAAELQTMDRFSTVADLLYMLAFLVSAICVGRWIYRANANAHTLSDAMMISPGWSVGWYFIPIASLFKPFQAMRETWQVSVCPSDPYSAPVPAVMRIWWGLWVASNILSNVSSRISFNTMSFREAWVVAWLEIATFVVDVPLVIALIIVMRRLTANQRAVVDTRIFE